MNNFYDYCWHDSTVEKIEIFEDNVILSIYNNALDSQVKITCSRTAGMTNLCMWEDTIITTAHLNAISDFSEEFIQSILKAHPQYEDYESLPVKNGLLDLAIKLTNGIVFHIYCYGVAVSTISTIRGRQSGDGSPVS